MSCKTSISGMMKVGNADYIIVTGFKDSTNVIEDMHKRKYEELLQRYEIREGTCAAALLKDITFFINLEGMDDEFIPYSCFLNDEKFERWSKSTIGNNMRRLAGLGIVGLISWDDMPEDKREYLLGFDDALLKKGIDIKDMYSKAVVPTESLPRKEFDELDELNNELAFVPGLNEILPGLCGIYGASEEIAALVDSDHILLEEYVGNLSLEERMAQLLKIYRNFVKPRKHIESGGYEKRRRVASEYGEKFQSMPHIKDVNISGSLAIGDDEDGSDVDLLLCRYQCPGKEICLKELPQADMVVEISCFTPEEIEELKQAGALVTYISIPYNQWKEINYHSEWL